MVRRELPHTSIIASDVTKVLYPIGVEQRRGYLNQRVGKDVSDFQWRVYDHIKQVPAGQITTYADIARALSSSPRAVGGALRINPFCPLVPCHRVVAVNGALTGFSGQSGVGSALDDKAKLLKEEGLTIMPDPKRNGYVIPKRDMVGKLWGKQKTVA